MSTTEKFDLWAIVELLGHQKIAGRCTEQSVAGTNMLRVDVPENETTPAFTRLVSNAAIYAINPVDEATARLVAGKLQVQPITAWDLSEVLRKTNQKIVTNLTAGTRNEIDEQEDFYQRVVGDEATGEEYDNLRI